MLDTALHPVRIGEHRAAVRDEHVRWVGGAARCTELVRTRFQAVGCFEIASVRLDRMAGRSTPHQRHQQGEEQKQLTAVQDHLCVAYSLAGIECS